MNNENLSTKTILFYDGYCKFCNGTVNFIIKFDKYDKFRFVSLQSELANEMLNPHGINPKDLDSLHVMQNYQLPEEKVYSQSTAVIELVANLGSFWKLIKIGYILPKFFRDFIYNIKAKNRYRIFGKYKTCPLPQNKDLHKYLDLN